MQAQFSPVVAVQGRVLHIFCLSSLQLPEDAKCELGQIFWLHILSEQVREFFGSLEVLFSVSMLAVQVKNAFFHLENEVLHEVIRLDEEAIA